MILLLIICVSCSGDYGMFLLKYAEYLMHDHLFSSLTGARIDWFREKMAIVLFQGLAYVMRLNLTMLWFYVLWRLIVSLDEFYVMLKVCNILYCCLLCLKHIMNRIKHFDFNSIHLLINTLCVVDNCITTGYET